MIVRQIRTFNFNGRKKNRWSEFLLNVREKALHEVFVGDDDVIQIPRLDSGVSKGVEAGIRDDAFILYTVPERVHGG